jgi:hypothetical protein
MKRDVIVRSAFVLAELCLGLMFVLYAPLQAQKNSGIEVDASVTGPRQVETLTMNSVARDYGLAWSRLAQAFDTNSPQLLEGYFVGVAQERFARALSTQQTAGLSSRFLDPQHKVVAVFYAPEGDVMELHDTVSSRRQVLKDGKVIHEDDDVRRYVVLMTPAVDRWVIRHIQEVENF